MNGGLKQWDNGGQVLRSSAGPLPTPSVPIGIARATPILPPRPGGAAPSFNSYMPYSSGYGGYNSYMYNNRPPMSMYNNYGYSGMYGGMDSYGGWARSDAEQRFIQFAEDSSRSAFSNVENIVRAVNSISMMLDNTFFAMTSSFRAILSVAENFGNLRSLFGQIWYSINVFRLFRWLYSKLTGYKFKPSNSSAAWSEAHAVVSEEVEKRGSNWPTLAFLGVLMSAPYFISKYLLPKFEDKHNPEKWQSSGVRAKAAFDFVPTSPNEMALRTNDELLLAPKYIQDDMKLTNSGWAFAVGNGKSGLVPMNYLVLTKRTALKKPDDAYVPVPRDVTPPARNGSTKRVSFGEEQIIDSNGTEHIVKIPDTDPVVGEKSESSTLEKSFSEQFRSIEKIGDSNLNFGCDESQASTEKLTN